MARKFFSTSKQQDVVRTTMNLPLHRSHTLMRNEVVVKHYAICMTTTSAELLEESYNNRNVHGRSCHILLFRKQSNPRVHYLFTIYLCIYLAKKKFGPPLSIYYLFVYLFGEKNSVLHYLFTIYLCIYLAKKIRSSIIYLLSICVSIYWSSEGFDNVITDDTTYN
jgi:hypothetical protein